ncbi:hypothetical protein RW115_11935 [Macrococcus capreoli]
MKQKKLYLCVLEEVRPEENIAVYENLEEEGTYEIIHDSKTIEYLLSQIDEGYCVEIDPENNQIEGGN